MVVFAEKTAHAGQHRGFECSQHVLCLERRPRGL
jgi:hypothetical protein